MSNAVYLRRATFRLASGSRVTRQPEEVLRVIYITDAKISNLLAGVVTSVFDSPIMQSDITALIGYP
jgi:hypothetical protein